jgi:hypothetical protein
LFYYSHILFLGNAQPLLLVLQDFTDGAALDAILRGDIFLPNTGIVPAVLADGLAVDIEESLLAQLLAR